MPSDLMTLASHPITSSRFRTKEHYQLYQTHESRILKKHIKLFLKRSLIQKCANLGRHNNHEIWLCSALKMYADDVNIFCQMRYAWFVHLCKCYAVELIFKQLPPRLVWLFFK